MKFPQDTDEPYVGEQRISMLLPNNLSITLQETIFFCFNFLINHTNYKIFQVRHLICFSTYAIAWLDLSIQVLTTI